MEKHINSPNIEKKEDSVKSIFDMDASKASGNPLKVAPQRMPPSNWEDFSLSIFSPDHAHDIQDSSAGLQEQEVCDRWGLDYSLLPDNDKFFFDVNFKIGRFHARDTAVKNLFKTMKTSKGRDSCMSYLLRFSDGWTEDVVDKAAGRTYNLVIG